MFYSKQSVLVNSIFTLLMIQSISEMWVFSWWAALLLILYTFARLSALALDCPHLSEMRPKYAVSRSTATVSIVIAVHNEEHHILRAPTKHQIDIGEQRTRTAEILVVSDASTDQTVKLAQRSCGRTSTRASQTIGQSRPRSMLDARMRATRSSFLRTARQRWEDGAIDYLLENFADATVGGVSGDLVVERANGAIGGVGIYWRYEKWLRQLESRCHSSVGATGAISAVRKSLFSPIPPVIVLDDVYWPLKVAQAGYRVIHDPRAVAYDRLPHRVQDEFRRKLRTLSGCFQLIGAAPTALLPWRNPIWLQFVSHKLLRLAVPWALLTLLVASVVIQEPLYRSSAVLQGVGYLWGLAGFCMPVSKRLPLSGAIAGFLTLQAAAWLAFWVWALGLTNRSWSRVHYAPRRIGRHVAKPWRHAGE